jgi:uncharacterized repeat protein (TIGR01451 family)
MKTTLAGPLVVALAIVLGTTACQQTSQQRRPVSEPTVASTPAPEPPRAAARTDCAEATGGLVSLTKRMPAEAQLGQEFEYQLVAQAKECVGNVVITDRVPAGASFVRSEPAAQAAGGVLTWRIEQMDAGQNGAIRVWLKADREGTLSSCATISADPRVCASTFVGRATLTINKSGPATALLGSTVNYSIVVSNAGSAIARNVVVTDTVPAGLESADGRKTITYELGDLAPKQARSINVALRAAARGEHCNAAVARSANAGEVSDDACTLVQQPGLRIVKTGDPERFLGRRANYRIGITNTGDTTLTDVVVTDTAPAPTSFVSAGGASMSGNQAVWQVGNLPPGQGRAFDVVLTSTTPGNHCNTATVTAAGGLRESAEACTIWRGVAAVLLEVVDDPDPIQADEQSTYTIRVTNQGTADLSNIGIAAEFANELSPVSSPQGTVSGQNVRFPSVARLAAKQSFTYTIIIRGVRPGDSRNKVTLTADGLDTPVVEEESTRVY